LSTAGAVVFGGSGNRFFVLDAYSGSELWQFNLGGEIVAAPITYLSSGSQRVTIAAGRAIFTFGLDDD
jgi:outer membrane protein assembly factor BamB